MPIAHACFVLDRVRMAGPSYAGLGSGSGLVGEGSSELGSELQNCCRQLHMYTASIGSYTTTRPPPVRGRGASLPLTASYTQTMSSTQTL